MKIWILNHNAIPPSMGGSVRHYYFAKYLIEKGHEVRLIASSKIHTGGSNMITGRELYKDVTEDGVTYTFIRNCDFQKNDWKRVWNILEFPVNLKKACRTFERPDIIYATSPDIITAFFGVRLAKKWQVPVAAEIRDLWPESIVAYYPKITEKNPIIRALYRMERWIYEKADGIVFTFPGWKTYFIEKGLNKKIDLAKIIHINNGIEREEFFYNKEHYIWPDEVLDGDDFKIVYTGAIRKVNNLRPIVECARILKEQGKEDIKFVIYGEGNERAELEKAAEGLDNIFFRGKVYKKYIPGILARASVNLWHVQESFLVKYGSSNNKMFDYIASGKKILCDIKYAYNPVEEYDLGLMVPSQKAEDIADGILVMYEQWKKEGDAFVNDTQALVREYDYRALADRLEMFLDKICRERR